MHVMIIPLCTMSLRKLVALPGADALKSSEISPDYPDRSWLLASREILTSCSVFCSDYSTNSSTCQAKTGQVFCGQVSANNLANRDQGLHSESTIDNIKQGCTQHGRQHSTAGSCTVWCQQGPGHAQDEFID